MKRFKYPYVVCVKIRSFSWSVPVKKACKKYILIDTQFLSKGYLPKGFPLSFGFEKEAFYTGCNCFSSVPFLIEVWERRYSAGDYKISVKNYL